MEVRIGRMVKRAGRYVTQIPVRRDTNPTGFAVKFLQDFRAETTVGTRSYPKFTKPFSGEQLWCI